ncbi:hypothetical protein D9758_005918 [Tetrapyrgos nigripes]|uniref:Alpha/beta-hydrolase n=1 Tax=Tetrapyrgos nigripes TaxID=182062 RepID=A0A8H5G2T6_9AGAR|nr:hypothetical protein D9758_005918 [Tetrapyrgos nigripes]
MTPLSSVSLLFGFVSLSVVLAQGTSEFDWNSIQPSTNFSWVDCYSGFQCARFKAPLDYSNPENGQSAAIAVVKLAAQAPVSEYGGPIFTNPGGPGVSGVNTVLEAGQFIQSVVGTQFDIIGFDPRGVNNTTPRISFFNTDAERLTFLLDERADLNSTPEALPESWARYQVAGQLAQSRDNGSHLKFVTTADVARDMLGMSESLGQENLQYWEFSYGTFLGSVFATMFPDRIERLVIDGVLDMDAWLANDLGGLVNDTDKTMQWFFDGCHAAGPENCAFYASSPAKIEAALDDIYDSLRSQPLPVFLNSDLYGVLTYDTLRSIIMVALYTPPLFPLLAQGLAEVQAGNGTTLLELLSAVSADGNSTEAVTAIECGDSDPFNADASQLREYMSRINSTFAGMLGMPLMNRCAGWKIHPEHRFKGPAGAANTSHPLLVIGNTADPATPLANAKKTSLSFPGSVLLTQDSPGHTSFITRSTCTRQHIAAYFANGTLPEEGTVCSLDAPLFPTSANATVSESPRSFLELPIPALSLFAGSPGAGGIAKRSSSIKVSSH